MSAYRCSQCSTNWPPTTEFANCPECDGTKTWMSPNNDPIDVTEALSRKRHADFERWYATREATHLATDLD